MNRDEGYADFYEEETKLKNADISNAGRAMVFLSQQLELMERSVGTRLTQVLTAQESLRRAIDERDAIQKALNLAAQFVARGTK